MSWRKNKAAEVTRQGLAVMADSLPPALAQEAARTKQFFVPDPRQEAMRIYVPKGNFKDGQPTLQPLLQAAGRQHYNTNFISRACLFWGSLDRAIKHRRTETSLPISKIGFDLARTLTSLGVLAGWGVFQRNREALRPDRRWQPPPHEDDGRPPISSTKDVRAFRNMRMRIELNTYKHQPSWAPQLAGALLPAQLPLSFFELTPSAVKILTKPSQPVFADVDALDAAAKCLPAGLFVLFHHQLGLVTDVQARLMGLHTLALAHLALPLSHVHQISGALRLKHQQELAAVEAKAAALEAAGTPRRVDVAEVWRPMQTFDMRQLIGQQLEERRQALARPDQAEAIADQVAAIEEHNRGVTRVVEGFISEHSIATQLEQEAMAYSLRGKLGRLEAQGLLPPGAMAAASAAPPRDGGGGWQRWPGSRYGGGGGGGGGASTSGPATDGGGNRDDEQGAAQQQRGRWGSPSGRTQAAAGGDDYYGDQRGGGSSSSASGRGEGYNRWQQRRGGRASADGGEGGTGFGATGGRQPQAAGGGSGQSLQRSPAQPSSQGAGDRGGSSSTY